MERYINLNRIYGPKPVVYVTLAQYLEGEPQAECLLAAAETIEGYIERIEYARSNALYEV